MSFGNHLETQQALAPSTNSNMNGGSAQESESRIGLLVSSFSSLLSFAHSDGVQLPTGDTSRKLSTLLSRFGDSSSGTFNGSSGNSNLSGTCALPCLRLRGKSSLNRFRDAGLQDVMATNMSAQVVADRSNVDQVPKLLLQNTASSFEKLISSRLRVSMQAITRTILKIGGEGNDARVLRKLLTTTSKPVKVTTVVTSYQLVNVDSKTPSHDDGTVVKPVVFETIVDLSIFGKMYTVSLEAPGTISATLSPIDNLLSDVKIMFDTMSLLKSMMTQARAIVKKTLKRAASITSTVSNYQQQKQESQSNNDNCEKHQNQHSSSSMSNKTTAQDELLASYPEHLRETVSHFLPETENNEDLNIEGFPPNLLQTLKSLSGGEESQQNEQDENLTSNNNQLHQGLFSWMNNDDMFLSQAQTNEQKDLKRKHSLSSQESFVHPLLKKSKKVSFCLPG